eukprot:TRINITY_DN52089_c0_g1_i1.p1 TRINITY_DN52089_c0_g1~~TRINITY_DN52089_c0_g1_i1.p1  ORF type:complete len:140 (-),score=52.76 TRINITY_DN52089_c0_g1_i1:120-539(-)
MYFFFFFQAEDGIRDAQESRGLGDVYKRQRPRREGEVVKNNDPRAGDVIRSMFGGEVNLRATRAEALQEREEADVVTRDDGDLTRAPHTGDAATRMEQIMTYWNALVKNCLLYTSDAADEEDSVDLGGRRIIKKKKKYN